MCQHTCRSILTRGGGCRSYARALCRDTKRQPPRLPPRLPPRQASGCVAPAAAVVAAEDVGILPIPCQAHGALPLDRQPALGAHARFCVSLLAPCLLTHVPIFACFCQVSCRLYSLWGRLMTPLICGLDFVCFISLVAPPVLCVTLVHPTPVQALQVIRNQQCQPPPKIRREVIGGCGSGDITSPWRCFRREVIRSPLPLQASKQAHAAAAIACCCTHPPSPALSPTDQNFPSNPTHEAVARERCAICGFVGAQPMVPASHPPFPHGQPFIPSEHPRITH